MSPDEKFLATYQGDTVNIIDLNSGKSVDFKTDQPNLRRLMFSPDGKMLLGMTILATTENWIGVWDSATGALIKEKHIPQAAPIFAAFSPSGPTVAISGLANDSSDSSGGAIWLWDLSAPDATPQLKTCQVTTQKQAVLRSLPGITSKNTRTLAAGQTLTVNGRADGDDGFVWYRTVDGDWVRAELVQAPAACDSLEVVSP